jgi:iron complex outermembrane recepter protein
MEDTPRTRTARPALAPAMALGALLLAAASLPRAAMAQETLAEIVVTAQKRAQNLQEVPVAVDAFSATTLAEAGAIQPVDLATMTPNLTAKNAVGNTAPIFALRGIGLNDFATNGTQPVGAYVDEVYMVNNSQLGFQLMDLERVEVLKGPQGTLYGRNTTAGAINFISRRPTRTFEAGADVTVGNFGLTGIESYINGALGDDLSGRFSFSGERQFRGYFTNDTDGRNWGQSKRAGWRGQLLWDLGKTSVLVNLHGGIDKSDDWYYKYVDDALGAGAYFKAAALAANPSIFHGLHTFEPPPYIDNLSNGLTVSVDHDYGFATVKSITSFESLEYARSEDYGSGPLPNGWNNYAGHLTSYSEELRLTSNGSGPWSWIVGAFAGHDRLHENDRYNELYNPAFPGYIFDERYLQNTRSLALFTHNEIALGERLRLTAGIRYTDEAKRYTGGTFATFTTTAPAGLPPLPASVFQFDTCPCLADTQMKYREPTGKLGLDYRFERVMLYVSASRGYKAGGITGFYVTDPGGKLPYKPEFVNAYELGFKSSWADNRLRLNGAVFYYDYKDLQAFGPEPLDPTNPSGFLEFRIFNVAKSRVQGAELEMSWLPLEGLKVDVGLGLLDTKVLESQVGGVNVGNRLGNAPNGEADTAISYKWALSPRLTATAGVDANWRGGTYYYVQNDPRQFIPAYFLWNPRFTLAGPGEVWSVKFWMKNASNKLYFREIFNDGGSVIGFPAPPRTFGATFSYRWQ